MEEEKKEEVSGIEEAEKNLVEIFSEGATEEEHDNIENTSVQEPKKGSSKVFFIILAIIVGTVAIASALTLAGVFDSKGKKFVDKLKNENLYSFPMALMKMAEKDGTTHSKVSLNVGEIMSMVSYEESSLRNLSIEEDSVKKGENLSSEAKVLVNESEIVKINLAKTKDLIGITIPGITKEYIAIRNQDLKALAKKFNMDDTNIPDKIDFKNMKSMYDSMMPSYQKFYDVIARYLPIIEKEISDDIVEESNASVMIHGENIKAKKQSVVLDYEAIMKVAKSLLEKAKDDKELYDFYVEQMGDNLYIEDVQFSDWQEGLQEFIDNINDALKEKQFPNGKFILSVYEASGKTIAIEFSMDEFNSSGTFNICYAVKNTNTSYYTELKIHQEEMDMIYAINAKKLKDGYEGNATLEINDQGETLSMNLVSFEMHQEGKTSELKTISESECFILNDKSQEEMETKIQEIGENAQTYLESIPEEVKELLNTTPDVDYDWEYDDEEDYQIEVNKTPMELTGTQVMILDSARAKYNSININGTKEELLALMGNPSEDDTDDMYQTLIWYLDEEKNFSIIANINKEKNTVASKSINIYSSSLYNVKLSSELGTTLTGMLEKSAEIDSGMTLSDVEKILGTAYYESFTDNDGYKQYEWYDIYENSMTVFFDSEGKVYFYSDVWSNT